LILGRLLPEFFPKIFGPHENEPLDFKRTKQAFEALTKQINDSNKEQGV
jgi:5-oxoprolinase (ATP-hydrolysing)